MMKIHGFGMGIQAVAPSLQPSNPIPNHRAKKHNAGAFVTGLGHNEGLGFIGLWVQGLGFCEGIGPAPDSWLLA